MQQEQTAPVTEQAAPVEQTTAATEPVAAVPPVAPAAPAAEAAAPAPPQADQAPRGRDAQARINQLVAKYKLSEEENERLQKEIATLKAGPAAAEQQPQNSANPYAPTESSGEAGNEDLEGLPPVVRKLVEDHARDEAERAKSQKLTEWGETIGKGFESYPELAGTVDDSAIALELKTRRVPLFNADLVFAAQALPLARQQRDAALKRVAELENELHKDTVASPVNNSNLPAPPDGTEKDYAPGERMAEARRKTAKH